MQTLADYCRAILVSPSLEAKLRPPSGELVLGGEGSRPADEPQRIDEPARTPGLALEEAADPLPRPGSLSDPAARARCLARFAHHELMAVELFAWALLRWPALPAELRRGWLGILRDEQRHCGLYLERLAALGSSLEVHPLSGYFWRHARTIADVRSEEGAAHAGPCAFLSAMGLTLEQANLDFTLVYRDAFREAGDETSARVCEEVHRDEIGHVRFARTWLLALRPEAESDLAAYEAAVPFPFSPARAKARRFDVRARREAGLSEDFIERVRSARSNQETNPARRR